MKMTRVQKSVATAITVGAMALLVVAPAAYANSISINGSIGFAGTLVPSGSTLNTSSTLTDFSSTIVSHTGAYSAATLGTVANFPDLTVTGPNAGIATPLWTFTVGGDTYSFYSTSKTSEVDIVGSGFLEIGGDGYATITGGLYSQTYGSWILTASQSGMGVNASFGFESTGTVVGVPDQATTFVLLGSAMIGLCVLRRKLAS